MTFGELMKNLMLFVAVLLLSLGFATAQQNTAGTVPVFASTIVDSTGTYLPSGTIYFAPTDQSGNPISYRMGTGGTVLSRPISATVTSGHFSTNLPDTSITDPVNVCFNVTIIDNNTGVNVLGPGYNCVQPGATSVWCLTGCDLDNFIPALPGLDIVIAGPTGPAGPAGAAAVVTSNGTSGGFAIPGVLSNGSGAPPLLPADPTLPLQATTKQYVDNTRPGIWQRVGAVMRGSQEHEWTVQEDSVIYDGTPHIIGLPPDGPTLQIFKMWYVCGFFTEALCYAESYDGQDWLQYGAPIIPSSQPVSHAFVYKDGSTYVMYAGNSPTASSAINRWTSSDGLSWTMANANVITIGSSGAWDAGALGNIHVTHSGSTFYAVYEAEATTSGPYISGVATSSDGITWTKYSGNPTITGPSGGAAGGPEIHLVNGIWHMWGQCSNVSTSEPTDMCRWDSSDFFHWTNFGIVLKRATMDEGVDRNDALGGQIGDPTMVLFADKTYMFYTSTRSQDLPVGGNDGPRIKLAIANMPLSQVVATAEGGTAPVGAWHDKDIAGFYRENGYPTPYEDDNGGEMAMGNTTINGGMSPRLCLNCYQNNLTSTANYTSAGPAAVLSLDKAGVQANLDFYPVGTAYAALGTVHNAFHINALGLGVSHFSDYFGLERASGGPSCTGLSAGTSCGVTINLNLPFPSSGAGYTVFGCEVVGAAAGTVLGRVSNILNSSFSVDEIAIVAGGGGGTISCLVVAN